MKYDFSDCIGSRMRKLSRNIDAVYHARLIQFGVTENQLTILFSLFSKNKIEQGKLGQLLDLERSTISRNIRLMEKEGWVVKSKDYRPIITMTKKGKTLVNAIIPTWEKLMDDMLLKFEAKGEQMLREIEEKF